VRDQSLLQSLFSLPEGLELELAKHLRLQMQMGKQEQEVLARLQQEQGHQLVG